MSGERAAGPRATPYDLVFVAGGFEPRLDEIRAEASARGAPLSDPEQFVMVGEVGRLIHDLVPEDADAASVLDVGRLIYHAHHFREAGLTTYRLERAALQALLEPSADAPPAAVTLPVLAGYLQLPRNVVWARVAQEAPWEAVDGLFWATASDAGAAAVGMLHVLLVLGIRPDRPGFSVVAVDAEELPEESDWSRVRARPEGDDFANTLPGGELSGLHALLNGAEVLKLLSRFFHFIADHPATLEAEPATAGSASRAGRRFRVVGSDGR